MRHRHRPSELADGLVIDVPFELTALGTAGETLVSFEADPAACLADSPLDPCVEHRDDVTVLATSARGSLIPGEHLEASRAICVWSLIVARACALEHDSLDSLSVPIAHER